jgi:hypothetical protein
MPPPQVQGLSMGRRSFVGGSDARIIMDSDEAALIRLWREKSLIRCSSAGPPAVENGERDQTVRREAEDAGRGRGMGRATSPLASDALFQRPIEHACSRYTL